MQLQYKFTRVQENKSPPRSPTPTRTPFQLSPNQDIQIQSAPIQSGSSFQPTSIVQIVSCMPKEDKKK